MGLFGPRYPQWRKHQIVKRKYTGDSRLSKLTPFQFVCEHCLQTWFSAEGVPRRCPGLPVYEMFFDTSKPDYLVTAEELKVLGLGKPTTPPLAYLRADLYPSGTEWTPLYDQRTMSLARES